MPTKLQSPGILAYETNYSQIVGSVSTSTGALAGVFPWGPVDQLVLVDSEEYLKYRFLKPSNFNYETWFTGANFLSYTDALYISRAADWTGNTVATSYTGNASASAIEANSNVLNLSNTATLSVGMILFYSNASALPDALRSNSPPKIASVVNATAVTLTEDATANVTSIQAVFREDIVFTSVAQEVVDYTIDWDGQIVRNDTQYDTVDGLFDDSVLYVARFPGKPGDSLRVAVCDSPNQFTSSSNLASNASINATASGLAATVGSNTLVLTVTPANTSNATHVTAANAIAGAIQASLTVSDLIEAGNSQVGFQYLKVTNTGTVTNTGNVFSVSIKVDDQFKLGKNVTSQTFRRYWEFYNLVDKAPGTSQYVTTFGNSAATDELHVVVVDEDGAFSESPGTVLETWKSLSRASDAKFVDGGSSYYKSVINQGSRYIWVANQRSVAQDNTASFITSSTGTAPLNISFYGGSNGPDESTVSLGTLTFAYDKFRSDEDVDISLVMQGKPRGQTVSGNTQLGNYIIDNISEIRGDCVTTVTLDKNFTVNNPGDEATDLVSARLNARYSSYGVLDSGYKYQYDRYNDLYRWVPYNGDVAGLMARTDATNDPWFSPAGYKRGIIKNVTKSAYNPRQSFRDLLYKNDINSIITQPGAGTLLFGDKTMLGEDSAFSRINVRRLFIFLKKAIKKAARAQLFELNDDFTRSAFRNMVNPFLKDVQGRRGIEDYIVICDTSNNGPEVRMRNEFHGTIGLKPTYSINFIYLQFVAVRADVAFSEVFA